eukprot:1198986-Prymnesium_polylepis.1
MRSLTSAANSNSGRVALATAVALTCGCLPRVGRSLEQLTVHVTDDTDGADTPYPLLRSPWSFKVRARLTRAGLPISSLALAGVTAACG